MDQTQTTRFVSRFEHPALRPRLHTEGFLLTRLHRTPTQGTSTEDLGQYNREYTTPLSTEYNLSLEAMHNQHKYHLSQEGQALSRYKSITSHKRDSNTNSTSHQREPTNNLHLSLEGANHHSKINLYRRGISQVRRVTTWWFISTTNNFFDKIKILQIGQQDMAQL